MVKFYKQSLIILFLLGLLISCKSTSASTSSLANLSTKVILKKNKEASFTPNYLKSNLVVKYKGKADVPTLNAALRMAKDSVIWISFSKLGFPVGKIKIEPNRVQFYEKLNRSFFDGDFKLISNWMGTDFDFNMVQNLFYGDALLTMKRKQLQGEIDQNNYKLSLKQKETIFQLLYWVDPTHFKLTKEEIYHLQKSQKLTILYKDFQKINESLLPKRFVIEAKEKENTTVIDVNYKNTSEVGMLKFPFSIPKNYKKIELK